MISQSNFQGNFYFYKFFYFIEGKKKTPEYEENPKLKKKLVKKIIKIKKEKSEIITPSGANEIRKKSNVSSTDIISIKNSAADKYNLSYQLAKNNAVNNKVNKLNKSNISSDYRRKESIDFDKK